MANVSDIEKLALDAVIKRQQSLLELMRHTDNRAQQFIVAYAGFMGAALFFSAREFSGSQAGVADSHGTNIAAVFMILYVVALLAGAVFGFLTVRPNALGLASRGPDFWVWALKDENSSRAIDAFLAEADKHLIENEGIQKRATCMLKISMACGAAAILISGIGVLAVVALSIV